jgi:hypothetical protein
MHIDAGHSATRNATKTGITTMKYLYNITVIQDAPAYGKNTITENTVNLIHTRDDLTERGIVRILKARGEWPEGGRYSHKRINCYA